MARIKKPEEYASKRGEILDAATRLVFTKGYEQTSVQDICRELGISSGAFHHYFGSRADLLDAFIERIRASVEGPLLPLVRDAKLSAVEKLQGFFSTLTSLRIAHKSDIASLGRVWYTDANALVRQKVDEAIRNQRAPLLAEIVCQGVEEGIFTTNYPDRSGEVILSLLHGMENTHAALMLDLETQPDSEPGIQAVVSTHAAYMEAIERVLGAPENSLYRLDAQTVRSWIGVLGSDESP